MNFGRAASTAAAVLLVAGAAFAQPGQNPRNSSKQGAPAAHAQQPRPAKPVEPGPYLKRERNKDWILQNRVRIQSDDSNVVPLGSVLPRVTPIEFKTVTMFYPLVASTASSVVDEKKVSAKLSIDNREVASLSGQRLPIILGAHSGSALAKIEYTTEKDTEAARQFVLQIDIPTQSARTVFDETAAMEVGWPTGDFPPAAMSTFEPQLFIDQDPFGPYDLAPVRERLQRWLSAEKITDPKSVPPVRLAKILAGKVVGDIQPSGKRQNSARTGELEGLEFRPPAQVLREGRGADHEIAALLTLVYRQVGLPARVVIAYEGDVAGSVGGVLDRKTSSASLRYWVEFCLYDEVNNTVNWIPVDVYRIRKVSSRTQPVDKTWRFFGTHDELEELIPFAVTFHPSAGTVKAYGSPGFWGWIIQPKTPEAAYQMLSFSASRPSKSGADIREEKRQKSKLPGT